MAIDVNLPKNRQGRYYHLNCGPGDLAPYLLTCGDPDRARRIAKSFDRVEVKRRNREFLTYTGLLPWHPGLGDRHRHRRRRQRHRHRGGGPMRRPGHLHPPGEHRGLAGIYQSRRPDYHQSEALREENTTHFYAPAEIKAPAHPQVLAALQEAAAGLEVPYHVGVTCTSPDFLRRPGPDRAGVSHPGAGQGGAV